MSIIRQRFENWYSENGKWPKAVERDSKGDYKLMQACAAWIAWRASAREFDVEDILPTEVMK